MGEMREGWEEGKKDGREERRMGRVRDGWEKKREGWEK